MVQFEGNYLLEKSEGFDEYMAAVGVGWALRKAGSMAKPLVTVSKDGDVWTVKTATTFKTQTISFEIGKEFEEETPDGRKVKTTVTMEGEDTMKHVQKNDKGFNAESSRRFVDDGFHLTLNYKDVTCKRFYKRQD